MSAIDVSELATELQHYLNDNPHLYTLLVAEGLNSIPYISYFPNVQDEKDLSKLRVSDPNQPGNRGAWQPKSDIFNFSARIAKTKHCEIALRITQEDIEELRDTHLAKKLNGEFVTTDAYDFPFRDFVLMHLLDKSWEFARKLGLFKGVHNPAGTTSADLYNGYLTILAADLVSGKIPAGNLATGGGPNTSNTTMHNALLVRDKLITQLPEYRDEPLVCLMAPENVTHFNTNYQEVFKTLPYNKEFKKTMLEGLGNCQILPEIGMTGSDRIIITTMDNLVMCSNLALSTSHLNVWPDKWDVDMGSKYKAQPEYKWSELIFCNDEV